MIHSRQSPGHMSSFSPCLENISAGLSPHRCSSSGSFDLDKYLSELLSERQKLSPFMQVLPNCTRLLNQEIVRLTNLLGAPSLGEHDALDHGSLLLSPSVMSNGVGFCSNGWSPFQAERVSQQTSSITWRGFPGVVGPGGSPSPVIKKIIRIDVPVDKYPNFNFVGRLLGPRGNSLKRVESTTGCRVFIRGRGSVRDSDKEEKLLDKPGCEHLSEPLHVLIEAVQPVNTIDIHLNHAKEIIEDLLQPVDESHDYFKKQQLRELAMLNGTLREDSPSWSGNNSPYSNPGMKRPKTRV